MEAFKLKSPSEILDALALRIKDRRIAANFTQRELASRSGVTYSTVRQLETVGKASLEATLKIAFALDAEDEFEELFKANAPKRIEDILEQPKRKRVRK